MSGATEFSSFFDEERKLRILKGAFASYHGLDSRSATTFDTNRAWTGKAALVQKVFPGAKIICCVREVSWVIDSLEGMLRKNPLQTSKVFKFQPGSSVYSRAEILMNSESGLIGQAWSTLREAWFSEFASSLIIVRYGEFVRRPKQAIEKLYESLGETNFEHDFDNVIYDEQVYDSELGMPGLHKVREKIEHIERVSCIPPDLHAKYAEANFWLKPEQNRRGVIII